jgi:formylglycine-generating enzyme required for sulfatase activity
VLFALLSAAAVFGEGDPPDQMTRREAHFHLVNGFGFFAGVGLLAAALVSAVSRRWAIRAGAFTAAAAVAAAANGGLGLLAPVPVPDVPEQAVVNLHLSDAAIQYRFDEQGPNLTGVFVVEHPLDPGEHWLWFKLGDRRYRTARFTVGPRGRPELDVTATADAARATLDGRPLAVTPDDPAAPPPAVAPFTPEQAKAHQEAWAAHLGVPVEFENAVGMKMRLIPPGEFTMGSTDAEVEEYIRVTTDVDREQDLRGEAPPRRARVDKPFYLAAHETTRAQFQKFVRATGYRTTAEANGKGGHDWDPGASQWTRRPEHTWRRVPADTTDQHPVGMMTLADAQAFCRWLSVEEGRTYAVPTEVQWEYACRAGTVTPWPCPRADLGRFAWFRENANRPQPVGRKAPNAFLLFDMLGNVEEVALTGGGEQAIRGGFVTYPDTLTRPAERCVRSDEALGIAWGFRVAVVGDLKVPAAKAATPPPAVAPFTPAQAKSHQEAWAARLGVPVEFAHPSGVAFRLVPPGEFGMGFTDAELAAVREELNGVPNVGAYQRFAADSSGPRHTVRITRPFYLAKYETTAGQFRRFVEATGHRPTGAIDWTTFVTPGQEDRQPVMGVSWDDAVAFGRWLGAGYELPSEAQWEYAARAGAAGLWSFGDDPAKLIDHAVVGQSGAKPGPVGLKRPNGFGLFDLPGGADEWCRDWHVADFYRRSPVDDPVNLDPPIDPATGRVSRGGSWNAAGVYSKAAFRSFDHPTRPALPKGFRVALTGDLKAAVEAATARKAAAEPGWVALFNGTDLTGWVPVSEGKVSPWDVVGGVLALKGQPAGYLRTVKEYREFHLRFEYRATPFAPQDTQRNSAVLWGVRGPDDPAKSPAAARLELVVGKDGRPLATAYSSKGVTPVVPPTNVSGPAVGDGWNRVELVSRAGELEVRVNGSSKVVKGYQPLPGFLGLHGNRQGLHLRNIEVRELIPVSPPTGPPTRAKD